MEYYEMLRQDAATTAQRPDIQLSLTNEQYRRLKSRAYEAGFNAPAELLANFVADLTDCQRNGSDECELANEWMRRAHGLRMQTAYFRHFLADTYPYAEEYENILNDEEWFNEIYEDYASWGIGQDLQNPDECKAVLKRLSEEEDPDKSSAKEQLTVALPIEPMAP